MNILILGSGGREHTFAWKIAQSPLCKNLFVAPGNSGTAEIATNVNIGVTDFEAIKQLVVSNGIDMVVVGLFRNIKSTLCFKSRWFSSW